MPSLIFFVSFYIIFIVLFQIKITKKLKVKNKKELVLLNKNFGIVKEKLNQHTLLIGATGSGKTTTIIKIVKELQKDKQKIVIIDGKGDNNLITKIKSINHNSYVWTIQGSSCYNFLHYNNYYELADKIMSLFDFSEPHYQVIAHTYLLFLLKILIDNKIKISWENIIAYFPLKILKTLLNKEDVINNERIKTFKQTDINGLLHRIEFYYQNLENVSSDYENLNYLLNEYDIILFSLNSLTYPSLASKVAKIIIQDLKAFAVSKDKNLVINLFFDEFNVFIDEQVINLINKTRSFNYHCFLCFQSISDLKINNCDLKNIIFANCANVLVHNIKDPETNDYLIRIFGGNENDNYQSFLLNKNSLTNLKYKEVYCKIATKNGGFFIKKTKIIN